MRSEMQANSRRGHELMDSRGDVMDRVKSGLHNFVKDKKKGLIIGTAVAVVGLGLGAGLLFNHGNSGGTESNGALNNPTVVSSNEKKNVVREDVQISSVTNFKVLSPISAPKGFLSNSDRGEDVEENGYITEGYDGARFVSENGAEDDNVDPVCGITVRTHKAENNASSLAEVWAGDSVDEIATNSQATRIINYRESSTIPLIKEKVTDLKIQSEDGAKNYIFPTMRYSSPNGGLVKYFGATKIGNGDIAAVEVYCFDQHTDGGYIGAQPLLDDAFSSSWKALDTIRIKPTE